MKKFLFAGLIAGVFAVGVMVPQAQARCWWNGYTWRCWRPHSWWWRHHQHWHADHYWYRPYAGYYWYQPYVGYYWTPGYAWSN